MEFKPGQEFVADNYVSNRHFKIISVNPVYEYNKSGKRKISGYTLKVEALHLKKEDWIGNLAKLYEQFRFFETTADAFEGLIRKKVIKEKK